MKDIVLVVVIFISLALSFMVVRFNEKATKAVKTLEEERYSRMVAEESLQKNSSKINALEDKLKSATDKMAKIEDILEQEKGVNQDLKNQYEKLSELKAELESKLQATIAEAAAAQSVVTATNTVGTENIPEAMQANAVTP